MVKLVRKSFTPGKNRKKGKLNQIWGNESSPIPKRFDILLYDPVILTMYLFCQNKEGKQYLWPINRETIHPGGD